MLEVGDLITDTSTQETNSLASRLCNDAIPLCTKSITFKGNEIMFTCDLFFHPYVFSDTISQSGYSVKLLMINVGLNYLFVLFKGLSRINLFRQLK